MTYQDLVLYVMSGTGNTYRVAQWVSDMAEKRGLKPRLTMIDDATPENRPTGLESTLFGFLFPAHGLMTPWSMFKFLIASPRGKGAAGIIISTRGGIKVGPIVIPGAVGLGNFIAALILLFKGYAVKGWFSLDMPVNMISLHWGMTPENIQFMKDRAYRKLEPVVSRALEGRFALYARNTIWEALWGGLLIWLVPVFPLLYLLFGKLFMAKLMYSDNRCISCGLCAKFCPNDAIQMKKIFGKKRPFWTYHCEACLRCMGYCRQNAVQAGHSWGVLLYFASTVPLITFFLMKLDLFRAFYEKIPGFWLKYLFQALDVIPALIIAYWIFWVLTRIPAINTIFSYTTLTRYFRRYHEPETRLKSLKKFKKKSA